MDKATRQTNPEYSKFLKGLLEYQKGKPLSVAGVLEYAARYFANSPSKVECRLTDSDGNDIEKCVVCGAEITHHNFTLADECVGDHYFVQILECKDCGALSFGWWRAEE